MQGISQGPCHVVQRVLGLELCRAKLLFIRFIFNGALRLLRRRMDEAVMRGRATRVLHL
jgi:hypothetical protein